MSSQPAKSFLAMTSLVLVVILAAAGSLNFLVDPYGMLGRNQLGIFVSNERITLPGLVAREPHEVLLLGNSKIAYVDPAAIGCRGAFNGAFGGAKPEEMLSFLREFGAGTRVVAIGFDLIMFDGANRVWQEMPFDPDTRLSPLSYVFSLDVVGDSLETLKESGGDEPFALNPNGQRNPAEEWALHDALDQPDPSRVIEHMSDRYRRYVRSERRIETLAAMRDWVDANEVLALVYLNPLHPAIHELLDEFGMREELSHVRGKILEAFPDAVDLTESRWSEPEGFFLHDPYHFKPETGADFLAKWLAERAPELCRGADAGGTASNRVRARSQPEA